eukprot:scaffold1541_cov67-Phaeocystis_antarctica.AAC.10
MQARLSAADEGAPPSSAAGGAASSAAGRTAAALASLVPRGLRKGTNIWTTIARRAQNFKQVLHEPSINPARQSNFTINPFLLARVLMVERRALLALDAKQPADRQPGAKP